MCEMDMMWRSDEAEPTNMYVSLHLLKVLSFGSSYFLAFSVLIVFGAHPKKYFAR